jgi:hypothetical protein
MGVVENLKHIADLIKKAGDIELYRKIIESEGEAIELTRENRRLEERVVELEKTLALQKQMHFNEPFYYQDEDKTPFCPACWEGNKKGIHVTFIFDNSDRTRWDCPVCKHTYLIEKKDAPPSVPRRRPFGGDPNSWMGG